MRANMKVVIRRLINALGYEVSRTSNTKCSSKSGQIRFPADFEQKNIEIIKLVQESTMTSIERINSLINAVQYIVSNNLEGTIVECGVWRGGSMMAIAYALQDLSDVKRDLFLFDTYEGMSPPTNKDIAHFNVDAQTLLNSKDEKEREAYFCYASLEDVQKNLRSTGYPRDKIHFIRGKVEDTIPEQAPDKIALLRLDTDWYESTRHELEHLFPRLVPGGVIIIDDYGYWKGCKQATDEYIQNNRIPILLNRIDLTGRIGIKLPTQHH